jgi:hypothetical protein
MRSGWDHDDQYLVYTCGKLGATDQNCVHGNADALSIDVSGFGETLLIDPGRYIYEGSYRIWFKQTQAHNTVVVDGQDSSELADEWMFKTWANSKVKTWASTEKYDFVDGSHDGYMRLEDPVLHRRRILYLKPHFWLVIDDLEAKQEHTYDQYFHFGPEAILNDDGLTVTARYPNGAGIKVKPVNENLLSKVSFKGNTNPIQGWVSYDYGVKVPADVIKYTVKAGKIQLATLLIPFKDKPEEFSTKQLDNDLYLIKSNTGSLLINFADSPTTEIRDFKHDGDLLCARFDTNENLAGCYGVNISVIEYKSRIILDNTRRFREDVIVEIDKK